MTGEKIEEFLKNKKGYLKEGGGRLCIRLNLKINTTNINLCKQSIKNVKSELNPIQPVIHKTKRLFWDIETSYNIVKSWRIGYNLNLNPSDIIHERAIICLSYKWQHDDKVHTIRWKNGCDKNIVKEFVKIVSQADECVGHNLKRFDEKWLMTRCIKHGILALPKYKVYDTLLKARSKFNFNSNKLDYIAEFLGLGNKLKHRGLDMWDDIILRKCPLAMEEMVNYCEKDVVLTEEVYNKLVTYDLPTMHVGVMNGLSKDTSPYTGSSNISLHKTEVSSLGTIKRMMKCNDTDRYFYLSNTEYLKII
jgi:hypothetical protein